MKSYPTLRPVPQNATESNIAKATRQSQDGNQPMQICKSPPARKFAWLILLSLALALQFSAGTATAATVTTDQTDYPPGATANITGSGFEVGETVQCQVLHADGTFD